MIFYIKRYFNGWEVERSFVKLKFEWNIRMVIIEKNDGLYFMMSYVWNLYIVKVGKLIELFWKFF